MCVCVCVCVCICTCEYAFVRMGYICMFMRTPVHTHSLEPLPLGQVEQHSPSCGSAHRGAGHSAKKHVARPFPSQSQYSQPFCVVPPGNKPSTSVPSSRRHPTGNGEGIFTGRVLVGMAVAKATTKAIIVVATRADDILELAH